MTTPLNDHINDLVSTGYQASKPFVWQVKEFHTNDYSVNIYHQIIMKPLLRGGYTAIISSDAFFHGRKKYNYKPNGIIYHKMDWDHNTIIANDSYNVEMGPYQIFQHESLWDFYNFIRWNWKKKKWMDITYGKINQSKA